MQNGELLACYSELKNPYICNLMILVMCTFPMRVKVKRKLKLHCEDVTKVILVVLSSLLRMLPWATTYSLVVAQPIKNAALITDH